VCNSSYHIQRSGHRSPVGRWNACGRPSISRSVTVARIACRRDQGCSITTRSATIGRPGGDFARGVRGAQRARGLRLPVRCTPSSPKSDGRRRWHALRARGRRCRDNGERGGAGRPSSAKDRPCRRRLTVRELGITNSYCGDGRPRRSSAFRWGISRSMRDCSSTLRPE
jgi:hypothetical protein